MRRQGGPGRGAGPRRGRRIAVWSASCVLAVLLVAVAGIAWYFSGVAITVSHTEVRDVRASVDPAGTSVTLSRDHYTTLPGRYGLDWDGGYAQVGQVLGEDATTVRRALTSGKDILPPNTMVSFDAFGYRGDPGSALGLAFQDVSVDGELGRYPAWYVPGSSGGSAADRGRTWVVFVHGHDSNRMESLRYLTAWHRLGLPVLVPTYRNDVGAPASPDGADHFGDTEWRDVESALRWAQTNGARDVVLAGWSMGGAVSLQAVDRSPLRSVVRGVLLDSPVLDWVDVFDHQGADRHLPVALTRVALFTIERRIGVDLGRFDWVARAKDLTKPMLVFASDDDTYVPDGPATRVAAARPDLVTLVNVRSADHTRSWNVDPTGYEQRMSAWLSTLGVATPQPTG